MAHGYCWQVYNAVHVHRGRVVAGWEPGSPSGKRVQEGLTRLDGCWARSGPSIGSGGLASIPPTVFESTAGSLSRLEMSHSVSLRRSLAPASKVHCSSVFSLEQFSQCCTLFGRGCAAFGRGCALERRYKFATHESRVTRVCDGVVARIWRGESGTVESRGIRSREELALLHTNLKSPCFNLHLLCQRLRAAMAAGVVSASPRLCAPRHGLDGVHCVRDSACLDAGWVACVSFVNHDSARLDAGWAACVVLVNRDSALFHSGWAACILSATPRASLEADVL